MEAIIETAKKPGDIKREAIVKELGEGWKFLCNYPVISRKSVNWQAKREAFGNDGQEIPFSEIRAAYFKPKTQVRQRSVNNAFNPF
jgi:hypothetical protein